ncbi:hypothetical protein IMSAGC013_02212 [Lachnospiraceae bacterium]|nr:hypothetical protein IMSAGC013_02212 [Lachnospiraceae bacterium]
MRKNALMEMALSQLGSKKGLRASQKALTCTLKSPKNSAASIALWMMH